MSKKKPVSAEEKRIRTIDYFHETVRQDHQNSDLAVYIIAKCHETRVYSA